MVCHRCFLCFGLITSKPGHKIIFWVQPVWHGKEDQIRLKAPKLSIMFEDNLANIIAVGLRKRLS